VRLYGAFSKGYFMSTAPVRTQQSKRGEPDSRQEALQAVEFAQSEVVRAEKHVAAVTSHYQQQLEWAQSWLRETERRLRVATMQLRRLEPVVSCQAVDPAPWLPPTAAPSLLDWQERMTLDAGQP
jgi:hypothetical protein